MLARGPCSPGLLRGMFRCTPIAWPERRKRAPVLPERSCYIYLLRARLWAVQQPDWNNSLLKATHLLFPPEGAAALEHDPKKLQTFWM